MEITCVVTKTQIVFPKIMDTIIVNKDIYADLIKNIKKEKVIFLLIIDEAKENNIGTVCKVISNFTSQKGVPTLVVGGMQRAIIEKVVKNKLEREDYFIVDAILFKKIKEETKSLSTQLAKELLMSFDKVLTLATIPKENLEAISNNKTNVGAICDIITNSLDFEMHKKYKILNAVKILDRFKLVLKYIEEYMEVLIISQEIIKDSRDSLDKKNKEFYLRNKIEIIQNKLKEETGELKPGDELVGYEEKIKNKNLPEEAYKEAMNELNRMKRMHSASHEYSVLSTYLDWMIDLPWNESTKDNLDIGKARKKLNEDHYGLESPKKRILEYLAIRKLNPNSRSPILCFVGPPGCIAWDTPIKLRRGKRNSGRVYTIKEAYHKFNHISYNTKKGKGNGDVFWNKKIPTKILSLKGDTIGYHTIQDIIYSGKKQLYTVSANNGKTIKVSAEHLFKVPDYIKDSKQGYKRLRDLNPGDTIITRSYRPPPIKNKDKRKIIYSIPYHPYAWVHTINNKNYKRINYARLVVEACMNMVSIGDFINILRTNEKKAKSFVFLPKEFVVHHLDGDCINDNISNLMVLHNEKEHRKYHTKDDVKNLRYMLPEESSIVSIIEAEISDTYDITMEDPYYNYIAEEFIMHNTGKTSLGKSIAESMGREFQRMSLGGIRDETIIRGFSRTYMGSRPGRIIQVLKRAGTNNPIIMLDEVDKLGSDVKGDPSSALLEALDPEQNDSFNDHYLNVPFDLSKVIFITTANMLEAIPHALQDRMEIIKFSGYSTDEKMKIATNFQIPRQLKEHGLKDLKFTKSAIDEIITGYTRESGVRNLEREIANVIRGIGTDFVEHNKFTKTISKKTINKYLGTPIYKNEDDIIIKNSGIGIGMYYSAVGGGITFYEAVSMHPQGKYGTITTSGSLKKVMEESIIVASKWIRSNRIVIKDITGINCNITHRDTHVHVPEGGTPKDGPSAGSAIIVALVSLYTGVIPKKMTAYTGEITLRGKILPVGGVREKVLGAHRAGIKNIVMPTWCKKDLDKIANDVKRDINFYFVDTIPEMLEIAFPKT